MQPDYPRIPLLSSYLWDITLARIAGLVALLATGAALSAQAALPPCLALVTVMEQDATTANILMVGPTKAQAKWLEKNADKGKYAGICYAGPLLQESEAFWLRRPQGSVLLGDKSTGTPDPSLPLYMIYWVQAQSTEEIQYLTHRTIQSKTTGTATTTENGSDGSRTTGNTNINATTTTEIPEQRTVERDQWLGGGSLKLLGTFGHQLEKPVVVQVYLASARFPNHTPDGPALQRGMDILADLLHAEH
jgi:hypothetical protein